MRDLMRAEALLFRRLCEEASENAIVEAEQEVRAAVDRAESAQWRSFTGDGSPSLRWREDPRWGLGGDL